MEVGLGMPCQNFLGLYQKFLSDLSRPFAIFVVCSWVKRGDARSLWIGVRNISTQSLAAKDHHKAMFLDRFNEDFDSRNGHLPERDSNRCAFFTADSTSAPVRDVSIRIQRAKIATNCDVTFFELKTDSGCLQGTASDLVLQRIVAEQAQVSGTASRSNSGLDWNASSLNASDG